MLGDTATHLTQPSVCFFMPSPQLPAEWLNVAKSEEMPETEEVDPAEEEAAMLAAQEANGSLSDSEPATPASQEEDAKGAAQTASV